MMTLTPPADTEMRTGDAPPEQPVDAPEPAIPIFQDSSAPASSSSGTHIPPEPIKAPVAVGLIGLGLVFGVGAWKPFIPYAEEGTAAAYWNEVVPLFIAELGVAAIVAYIIGWSIDAQAKRREEKVRLQREEQERQQLLFDRQEADRKAAQEKREHLEREQRMTQDVFRGVLGIRHRSDYVRKVIESTLDRKVVRRHVTLMYKLARLTKEEAAEMGIQNPEKFIFLDQAVTFEFENLSSDDQKIPIKFAVPARHGSKLRSASRVVSAIIGGKEQPINHEALHDPHSDAKTYTWPHTIPPNGKLSVAVKSRVIKEDSDSEVWCSYYPCTEGMSLQVTAPDDLHMGLRNNTASPETEEIPQGANGMAIWKINGPILPNNSVVFYWRTPEHDGEMPVETEDAPNHVRGSSKRGTRARISTV